MIATASSGKQANNLVRFRNDIIDSKGKSFHPSNRIGKDEI